MPLHAGSVSIATNAARSSSPEAYASLAIWVSRCCVAATSTLNWVPRTQVFVSAISSTSGLR